MEAEEEAFLIILDPEAEEVKAAKQIKRNACRSLLIQMIADRRLEYVKDKDSPKKILGRVSQSFPKEKYYDSIPLEEAVADDEVQRKRIVARPLLAIRPFGSGSEKSCNLDVICHLMSERLTMDLVRWNYLDVEAKRRGQHVESNSNEAAFSSKQGKFKC